MAQQRQEAPWQWDGESRVEILIWMQFAGGFSKLDNLTPSTFCWPCFVFWRIKLDKRRGGALRMWRRPWWWSWSFFCSQKVYSHCQVLSISGFQNLSFGRLGRWKICNSRAFIVRFLYLSWINGCLPSSFPETLRYLTNFDTYKDKFPPLPKWLHLQE